MIPKGEKVKSVLFLELDGSYMDVHFLELIELYIYISKGIYVLYFTIKRLLTVKKEINKKAEISFVMKHGALISLGQNY